MLKKNGCQLVSKNLWLTLSKVRSCYKKTWKLKVVYNLPIYFFRFVKKIFITLFLIKKINAIPASNNKGLVCGHGLHVWNAGRIFHLRDPVGSDRSKENASHRHLRHLRVRPWRRLRQTVLALPGPKES